MTEVPNWPPRCKRCGEPLHAPGALAFAPPKRSVEMTRTSHVCRSCWPHLEQWLDGGVPLGGRYEAETAIKVIADYIADRHPEQGEGLSVFERVTALHESWKRMRDALAETEER